MAAKKKGLKKKIAKVVKAKRKVLPIPKGYHSLTPSIVVNGAAKAIEFYKRAFNAKQRGGVMPSPDGKILHAEIQIGDSIVMLSDEFPDMGSRAPTSLGGTASALMFYVRDADAAFKRAVDAGATVKMPLADMFWGDRYGLVADPFGHEWAIATHKEDLSPKEMMKRAQAAAGPQA